MREEAAALSITGKLGEALIPEIPINFKNSKQILGILFKNWNDYITGKLREALIPEIPMIFKKILNKEFYKELE